MAIFPARIKDYQWVLNDGTSPLNIVTTPGTMDWPFKLVQTLTKFSIFPWQVMGSSNAVTAGMDGVNRWGNVADVVRLFNAGNVGARSWIVIYQPATGVHWLLHAWSAGGSYCGECWISYLGFTGGSTGARPTALDEFVMAPGAAIFSTASGGSNMSMTALHVWHSTDGQQTRVVGYQNAAQFFGFAGFVSIFLMITRVSGAVPPSVWPHPEWFWGITDFAGFTAATLCGFDNGASAGKVKLPGSGAATAYLTTLGSASFSGSMSAISVGEASNQISGLPGIYPYGVTCQNAALRYKLGCIPDLWSRSNNLGNTAVSGIPNGFGNFVDASNTGVIMEYHVHPWDPNQPAPTF